jgi:hypothetical protein
VTKFPADRFDDKNAAPARVGAHRSSIVRRKWWVAALIAVGSTAAIILAALVGISVIDAKNLQDINIPAIGITATPTPTPTPTPTVVGADPTTIPPKELKKIVITVLNGTPQDGLAESVVSLLKTAGWVDLTAASASDTTIKVSVVVYGPETDKAYANGVAASLGIKAVKQSDMYPGANVTVLLGSDFVQQ